MGDRKLMQSEMVRNIVDGQEAVVRTHTDVFNFEKTAIDATEEVKGVEPLSPRLRSVKKRWIPVVGKSKRGKHGYCTSVTGGGTGLRCLLLQMSFAHTSTWSGTLRSLHSFNGSRGPRVYCYSGQWLIRGLWLGCEAVSGLRTDIKLLSRYWPTTTPVCATYGCDS